MRFFRSWTFFLLALFVSSLAATRANTPVISELMARNDDVLADQDGDFSDWIEIYNAADAEVALEGWSLTDDAERLDRWKFPAVTMQPNTFLIVFASGKDLTDPAGELHTNFKLSGGGEYLALVNPAGQIVSEYKPEFEPQVPYASYGINMGSDVALYVEEGATARYHVPTDDAFGLSWTERDFDDGAWASGPTGIGFDESRTPDFTDEIVKTNIAEQMRRVNASVYVRMPFTVEDPSTVSALLLHARYDDGMVIFVNGMEAKRVNLDDELTWESQAARARPDEEAVLLERNNISSALGALVAGENVLAIQGLNSTVSGSDFLLSVRLEGVIVGQLQPDVREYFPGPSPGWPNSGGVPGIAEAPTFSKEAGAVTEAFALELTSPAAQIRYTLVADEDVTEASDLYTGPITIDGTTVVRARSFQDGLLPSEIVEVSYIVFEPEMLEVSSNLPIVVINTFGKPLGTSCDKNNIHDVHLSIIERGDDGRAHITSPPAFAGKAGMRSRGSSTCGRAKQSWNVEFRDEAGADESVEVLGFPKESDFVMYAAFNFDTAHMRNAFIYEISNQVGRWAPHTRFVEVYLNRSRGAPVGQAHYWGVYTFMEKIKQGPDRVDVADLSPDAENEPEVTGGYIFKIDRSNDPGDVTVPAQGAGSVVMEYPKTLNGAQRSYLQTYFADMNRALSQRDPLEEGRNYIDVDSWIDHHILMMFPKNVDAFRLSGYFYKDREGKVGRGPIWDYDRAMGSTDGRDRFPDGWQNNGGDGGTLYFTNDWYRPLFAAGVRVDQAGPAPLGNDEWATLYRARWRELRAGPLSTDNLVGVIDSMAEEIGESADRDWLKWRQGPRDYATRVATLRDWITARVDWIDSQFIDPPVLSVEGGLKTDPFDLEITVADGQIYYTLNGPDPKQTNGEPDPAAIKYAGPITIAANTRVWARARVGGAWSESAIDGYYFELAPLVITEIMYNPATDTDHEFIEFQNVGSEPIDLNGIRLVNAVSTGNRVLFEFTGSAITTLGPGEYALAVNDIERFTELYGGGLPIAGEFDRTLTNSSMALELLGAADEPLLVFQYDDDWVPSTDGEGYSLVIRDPLGPREAWDTAEGWRASVETGGSPGRADGGEPAGMQLPGDLNQDRKLNLTDAVNMLRHLFQGGASLPCSAAGNEKLLDMNGDAEVNITDVVHTLGYLFQAGAPPALGARCVPIEGCPAACE